LTDASASARGASLKGLWIATLVENAIVPSPFDLCAVVLACVERFKQKGAVHRTTESEADRLITTVWSRSVDATGTFDSVKYNRFCDRMLGLKRARRPYLHEARQAQERGELRKLPSGVIVVAAMAAMIVVDNPRQFIADALQELKGHRRRDLSELLYWTDVVLAHDHDRLVWWHLSLAVVDACVRETERRLAEHPTSSDVYRVIGRDDNDARKRLSILVQRWTHDLFLPSDDKAFVVRELLDEQLAHIGRKYEPLLVLVKAMDGEEAFECLPRRVQDRFKSEIRKAHALKRGGDEINDVDDESSGRSSQSERRKPGDSTSRWKGLADNQDVMRLAHEEFDPLSDGENERLLSKLQPLVGPAMPLVRLFMSDPDSFSDTEKTLGRRLGRTPRTIRNWKRRLESPEVRATLKIS
jgi:hypothetical protein